MEKKLINEDPLNPAKPSKLYGNYETPLYHIDIVNNDMEIFFIKFIDEFMLYGSMKEVLKAFKNIAKKEASWVIVPCTYLIKELKNDNGAFNWYEVCFRCKIETGTYPSEWSTQDKTAHILKCEMPAIEKEVTDLRELLIAHLCIKGQILVNDVTYKGMPYRGLPHQRRIGYKGVGFLDGDLNGCASINFYVKNVKICHYLTWLS